MRSIKNVRDENREKPGDWVLAHALETYYGEVIHRAETIGTKKGRIEKGDVAIWHPQLPHGEAPAEDPQKTRRSMIFHCAPETIQVYQHDIFFQHEKRIFLHHGISLDPIMAGGMLSQGIRHFNNL